MHISLAKFVILGWAPGEGEEEALAEGGQPNQELDQKRQEKDDPWWSHPGHLKMQRKDSMFPI